MNYATRLNSFLKRKGQTMAATMAELGRINGITHVDINYPEHLEQTTLSQMKSLVEQNGLKVNGLALRFPDGLIDGEFTNHDHVLSDKAKLLCQEAVQACRELGGEIVTVWQAFDGFDYPFQVDYVKAWGQMRDALREIADAAAPDIRISIEYKPFQPRAFSLVPNMATAMMLVEEIGRENVGLTLDFCHMLMAGENPATALAFVASRNRLLGVHLNDGYRLNDDGLMVGSVHPMQTLEFLYYAKKYGYSQVIYFDTFPLREDPVLECRQNIRMVNKLISVMDEIGLQKINEMVLSQKGTTAMEILHGLLK